MRDRLIAPTRIKKPWGYELLWAVTDRYAGKILHVDAGHTLSLQLHRTKDEWMYCLSGRADLELDGERFVLEPGAGAHIRAGAIHRLHALIDTEVVEVSTPELDDVVRIADRYGRVSESVAPAGPQRPSPVARRAPAADPDR
jgi:mannose-6-phosphate isomerase-like protein (cupin superfamily)